MSKFDLITMGEVMLRLSPQGYDRLSSCATFDKNAGGSELNVAAGAALLGIRTGIITKLPDNDLGRYIKNEIRFEGVSDDYLIYDSSDEARLGIYYYEYGAAPRKPTVVYDRRNSSFTRIRIDEIPESVYSYSRMFHTSGITLALCDNTRDTAIELIRRFKDAGAMISFDCNYRANLWGEEKARQTIYSILPYVDILFVSEETSRRMMQRKEDSLMEIMRGYVRDYPGIRYVCTTQRKVKSPKVHDFTSMIYSIETGEFYSEAPYNDIDVVDRIGSGDAYVAGALYGLLRYGDPQKALEYGDATSSTKCTITGDLPLSDLKEIDRIIRGHKAKGQADELNR